MPTITDPSTSIGSEKKMIRCAASHVAEWYAASLCSSGWRRLPAAKFWLLWPSRARVELFPPEPPWVRLGAPGFSLPSGVGVEVGVGVPAR